MASSGSGGNAGSSHWVGIAIALITAVGVVIAAIVGGPHVVVDIRDQGQATGVAQLQPTIDSLRDQATPTNMPVVTAVTAVTVVTAITAIIVPPPVTAVTAVTAVTVVAPTNIPSPTPNPTILFSDGFEDKINPAWNMTGENYALANGKLVIGTGGSVQSSIVGDRNWKSYRIRIYGITPGYGIFSIMLHAQNKDNYIAISCGNSGSYCDAYEVVEGSQKNNTRHKNHSQFLWKIQDPLLRGK